MGLVMPNCPVYHQNQKQPKGKKIGKLWLVTIFSSTSGKMSAFSCLLSCLEETFGTDLIKEYLVLDYNLVYLKQVRRLSIS